MVVKIGESDYLPPTPVHQVLRLLITKLSQGVLSSQGRTALPFTPHTLSPYSPFTFEGKHGSVRLRNLQRVK